MKLESKLNLDWNDVEEALSDDSPSGYKIAVLETDKVFREYLERFKYLGSDPEKKIRTAGRILNKAERLSSLRALKEKILEEKRFVISREDAKEIISEYWKIIKALDEYNRLAGRTAKFWLRSKNLSFWSFLKNFIIAFFILIIAVNFFSRTAVGREIVQKITEISALLFWEIIVIIAAVIMIALIYLIKNRYGKVKSAP